MIAERLDPILRQIVEMHETPGLAVGIVRDDNIIFAAGYGVKSIETSEPVATDSLFHMASVSKIFVATAVVQLVEQGSVDLDARVVNYLPYFEIDDERYREITIQQMLSHTSGMPDVEDYEWDKPQFDEGALERYVRSLGDLQLLSAPGEKFAYSNIAFEILGDLIAKVSGQSFAEYAKEKILNSLGMAQSTFLKPEASPELLTTPHLNALELVVSDLYPYNRAHGPSSTLHSSVVEMCNWARANLNRGEFQGQRILEPGSYDLLWEPRRETGQGAIPGSVGLSWFIGEHKGFKTIGHSGGDVGFRTHLGLLPDEAAAVIVLANAIPAPIEAATEAALDVVLGLEPEVPKPPVLVSLRKTYLDAGYEVAMERCRRLKETQIGTYDCGPDQFFHTGYVLAEMGSIGQAMDILRLGLELNPDSDDLLAFLALGYLKSGDNASAIRFARQSLALNPRNPYAAGILEQIGEQ